MDTPTQSICRQWCGPHRIPVACRGLVSLPRSMYSVPPCRSTHCLYLTPSKVPIDLKRSDKQRHLPLLEAILHAFDAIRYICSIIPHIYSPLHSTLSSQRELHFGFNRSPILSLEFPHRQLRLDILALFKVSNHMYAPPTSKFPLVES